MRIFEFMPIRDCALNDGSLIEMVFGPEFCVVDEAGCLLTTSHNQNLLRRAKMLLDHRHSLDRESFEEGLAALKAKAEMVAQREYELAVRREMHEAGAEAANDLSLWAGSLT